MATTHLENSVEKSCSGGSEGVSWEEQEGISFSTTYLNYYLLPSFFSVLCFIPVFAILYRYVWRQISNLVWNSLTISVEVHGPKFDDNIPDQLYYWVLQWFAKNIKDLPHSVAKAESDQDNYGKIDQRVDPYPGFGVVIHFQYKGQWIQMERICMPEIRCFRTIYEKLVFTSYRHNRALIYEFLDETKPKRSEGDEKFTVYAVEECCWEQIGHPKRRRPLSSVMLAEGTKEKLIADVKDFRASEEWYLNRGIAYRRGYLLYGPPGCGKSSIIKGIAGEFGYDICILSLTAKKLTDDSLNMLMNTTPENCLILLEDVDAAFRSREDTTASNREQNLSFEGRAASTVTFGGLLNALDGVASTEGRIVFMTTNYIERLDAAMVRPGRVDMKLLIDLPNDEQLEGLFGRFYLEAGKEMKSEFVKRIRALETQVSMAEAQGLFMFHKDNGQEAIDGIETYFKDQIMISNIGEKKGVTEALYG